MYKARWAMGYPKHRHEAALGIAPRASTRAGVSKPSGMVGVDGTSGLFGRRSKFWAQPCEGGVSILDQLAEFGDGLQVRLPGTVSTRSPSREQCPPVSSVCGSTLSQGFGVLGHRHQHDEGCDVRAGWSFGAKIRESIPDSLRTSA